MQYIIVQCNAVHYSTVQCMTVLHCTMILLHKCIPVSVTMTVFAAVTACSKMALKCFIRVSRVAPPVSILVNSLSLAALIYQGKNDYQNNNRNSK